MSGMTSAAPMFAPDRLANTLSGGYINMIGVLSSDPKGLLMMERWRMINMMYHIIELKERPDLTKLILANLDYNLYVFLYSFVFIANKHVDTATCACFC